MKRVNIQSLYDKLTMIYGDECEKNVVGMVIFENNGEYFFDEEFKHIMNNEEVEALLLRGAVINKENSFYSPASFNSDGVQFGSSESEHEHEEYITEAEVNRKILEAQIPEADIDLSSVLDFTVTPNFDAWTPNLIEGVEAGYYSGGTFKESGAISHVTPIDVTRYSKIRTYSICGESQIKSFSALGGFYDENMNQVASLPFDAEATFPFEYTVPDRAKYVIVNIYYSVTSAPASLAVTGFVGGEGEMFVNGDKIYPPINEYVRYYYGQQYAGKKWVSFGDSITAQGTWQPIVVDRLGLIHVNCGVGSTCMGTPKSDAYLPEKAFHQDLRLDAVKAEDPDIVTILGGANDLYAQVPVGSTDEFAKALDEKDKSTFLGAYSYIIENLLTWKPTLKIIILTTTFGHNNKKYSQYADASREVAYNYGLLCADLYRKTGFNSFTAKQGILLKDSMHPNAAGGARIAEVVIATMLEG